MLNLRAGGKEMIEIGFPDEPASEASILAQELAQTLRLEGVADAALSLVKERPEAMDLGTALVIAELAVGSGVIIQHLFELWYRTRCTLRITTPRGQFVLRASEVDLGKLREVLEGAFK